MLALLGASLAVHAQSTTYRWVDERGRVNYSDHPPPPSVRQLNEKRFSADAADTVPGYTLRRATTEFPVLLYTAVNCGELCTAARDLLRNRGVPFTENSIATPADLEGYRQRFGTPEEVPAMLVGRTQLKGFAADTWQHALDSAGYPKTPIPAQ